LEEAPSSAGGLKRLGKLRQFRWSDGRTRSRLELKERQPLDAGQVRTLAQSRIPSREGFAVFRRHANEMVLTTREGQRRPESETLEGALSDGGRFLLHIDPTKKEATLEVTFGNGVEVEVKFVDGKPSAMEGPYRRIKDSFGPISSDEPREPASWPTE
jgi:hypothetical protein